MKYDFDLENKRAARKRLIRWIVVTAFEAAVVVLVAYAVTHYGLETYTVSGQDMSPTLEVGDRILINKFSYQLRAVRRNDVVVLRQSDSERDYYYVERVIGLPGETVQIENGRVFIDGKEWEEQISFPSMENGGLALEPITLGSEEYFVLCDNRNVGVDSRNAVMGNIVGEDIVGKAWFRLNTMEFIRYLNAFDGQEQEEEELQDASSSS